MLALYDEKLLVYELVENDKSNVLRSRWISVILINCEEEDRKQPCVTCLWYTD